MNSHKVFCYILGLIFLTGLSLHAAPEIGQAAPGFKLLDAQGEEHDLATYKGKYVVLEWINFDCPFVVKHYSSDNMPNLQKKYTAKEVVWLSICSSALGAQGHFEGDELFERCEKENYSGTAYLIDEDGKVGHLYGAKTTPNMYVVNPEGVLIYTGAIDSIKSTNVEDIGKATNYVQAALDAAMAGEKVATSSTAPYGCGIKYAKK